jgi:C-terminal processing protease CtpA/Prc
MTRDLEATLTSVRSSGAEFLLVDLAGNGGGNNWVDAAVRMVTAKRLRSTPMYFMKGQHWAARLAKKESDLRAAAATAGDEDRRFLLRLADTVDERKRDAETPCDGEPLWSGKHPGCVWLGDGFYSGSLLQSADPETLRGKPWAPLVFTPMQFPYREGVWNGPLVVIVDGYTGSSAELFAAELQDDHAAVIVGSPTIGAGCGHTDGGTPTTLKNSGVVLSLSDCAHIRPGGLNMTSGVQPDVLVGLREDDSPKRRALLLAEKLGDALERAKKLH